MKFEIIVEYIYLFVGIVIVEMTKNIHMTGRYCGI